MLWRCLGSGLLAIFLLIGLGSAEAQTDSAGSPAAPSTASAAPGPTMPAAGQATIDNVDNSYRLGTDDKIRVIVYGEVDLGGEFVVDSTGYVRFPLVGQIKASGLTVHEVENEIENALKDGYVKDPRVNVEVETYRPFYIIGEVNKPGEYPYVNGMNVINAVALAGGYTYRADDSEVYIRHNGAKETQAPADQTTKIMPGDIVRIGERFF